MRLEPITILLSALAVCLVVFFSVFPSWLVVVVIGMLVALTLWRPVLALDMLIVGLPLHEGIMVIGRLGAVTWWKEAVLALLIISCLLRTRNIPRSLRVLPIPGVILALWAGAALWWSPSAESWAWGMKITFFYMPLVALVPIVLPDHAAVMRRLQVIVWVALAVAIFGLWQVWVGHEALAAMGFQYDTHIRFANGSLRAFSTFRDTFGFAYFLMVGLIVTLHCALTQPHRKLIYMFASAIMAAALVQTHVRGAVVGLVVGCSYYLLQRPTTARKEVVGAVGLGLIAAGIVLANRGGVFDLSFWERISTWSQLYGTLVGWGAGLGVIGAAAGRVSGAGGYVFPDNNYVQVLIELGLPGILLLMVLLITLFRRAMVAQRYGGLCGAVLSSYAVSALWSNILQMTPLDFYFWFFAGLSGCAIGVLGSGSSEPNQGEGTP